MVGFKVKLVLVVASLLVIASKDEVDARPPRVQLDIKPQPVKVDRRDEVIKKYIGPKFTEKDNRAGLEIIPDFIRN